MFLCDFSLTQLPMDLYYKGILSQLIFSCYLSTVEKMLEYLFQLCQSQQIAFQQNSSHEDGFMCPLIHPHNYIFS